MSYRGRLGFVNIKTTCWAFLEEFFSKKKKAVVKMEQPIRKLIRILRSPEARKVYGAAILIWAIRWFMRLIRFLRWRRELCERIPGGKPSLFIGDLKMLLDAGGFNEQFFINLHSKYGELARFWLSPTMMNVSLTNPNSVHELYKKTHSRPHETYMFLKYLGDDNLMFQHGPLVKKMRMRYGRMISNTSVLEKLNDATYREFGRLADKWSKQEEANVHKDLGPVIYDVMGNVLFGGRWSTTDIGQRIYKCHLHLINYTDTYMFWPFPPWFLSGYRKYRAIQSEWYSLCEELIEDRRAEYEKDPKKFQDDESALTMFVTDRDKDGKFFFSKSRAISTMCGFLNGAYDTTHATMYWLLWNLAKHQHVQRKLKEEIRKHLGTRKECSIKEAREIEYLDAYIHESIRFHSTVTVNQRVNLEEDITIGGYVVPKGVNVNVPNGLIFRRPEFFGADADEFRPERFLKESPINETARRAWVAFGGHTRMCIGYTFAMVEVKAMLIAFMQQFHIDLVDRNDPGKRYLEAGVNQPLVKAKFKLRRVDAEEQEYAKNLEWWSPKNSRKHK